VSFDFLLLRENIVDLEEAFFSSFRPAATPLRASPNASLVPQQQQQQQQQQQ